MEDLQSYLGEKRKELVYAGHNIVGCTQIEINAYRCLLVSNWERRKKNEKWSVCDV